MKNFLIILLLLLCNLSFAQKPIVGFTEDEIITYNRMEFGTSNFKRSIKGDFYVLETKYESLELITLYFFRPGYEKNILCGHSTINNITARIILQEIRSNSTYLGNNSYRDYRTGLDMDYSYSDGVHSFLFYKY